MLPESAATRFPELSTNPFNHTAEVTQGTTDPLLNETQSSYGPQAGSSTSCIAPS